MANQEDQIRDYRRLQRLRNNVQRWVPTGRFNRTIESQIDPEAELRISQARRSRLDGTLSLRFAGYKAVRETGESSRQASQDNEDEELIMREMAAAVILERFIDFDLLRSLHFMKPRLPVEIREEIYKRKQITLPIRRIQKKEIQ
ncbi:hypothetical protein E3N88_18763 [Mikania micrantha]|uniref:Uncharacterized protein n=1 Tax=Mikania micrantha TaxID=192012 RepID=A0A5N6NPA6_9ASTR|nr:hypothetical protein E3N88_18763 [Mikania micrantha]